MNRLFATLATVAVLCFQPLLSTSAAAQVLTSSTKPVTLYKESTRTFYVYHGVTGVTKTYLVLVSNLAFQKSVNIRFEMADGTWKDVPASFDSAVTGNQELWKVVLTANDGWGKVAFSEYGKRFAVNYTVNGRTYWDNNGGANYTDVGTFVHPAVNVQLGELDSYGTFSGNALVRNVAYGKKVTLVYSTDNWATTRREPMYYASAVTGTNLERWTFSAYGMPSGTTVKYALSYEVNGQTYWDNNFGRNYTFKVP